MASSHHPKLSATLIWFSVAMFAVAILILAFPVRGYLRDYESGVQTVVAERAGRSLQLIVSRAVGREWESLNAVASQIDIDAIEQMQGFTDAVVGASQAVAWVGIATADGTVLAGSGRVREGEDVGFRRWFRDGLEGGSVGSVYIPERATVPGSSGGLVNMSVPVLDSFGNPEGVAVYSVRIDWLNGFIREAADQLEVDLQVVAGDGSTIVQRSGVMGTPMPENVAELTSTGQALTRIVATGTGERAIVAVQPELLIGDLPFFDWDLVVRVPARTGNGSLAEFMTVVSRSVGFLFGVVSLLSLFFARHFLSPIGNLARDARAIADGQDIYPTEDTSSRESAALSDALARLQSQVRSRYASDGPGGAAPASHSPEPALVERDPRSRSASDEIHPELAQGSHRNRRIG